jgi:hypothetical protein
VHAAAAPGGAAVTEALRTARAPPALRALLSDAIMLGGTARSNNMNAAIHTK